MPDRSIVEKPMIPVGSIVRVVSTTGNYYYNEGRKMRVLSAHMAPSMNREYYRLQPFPILPDYGHEAVWFKDLQVVEFADG